MAAKSDTAEILKDFIKRVENLISKTIKVIRSDNGWGYKNRVLEYIYKEKGIKQEFSVARTPQQNGVAERRNRTLLMQLELCLQIQSYLQLFGQKLSAQHVVFKAVF